MPYQILTLLAGLLVCVGCQKTAPPTPASGEAATLPSSSAAAAPTTTAINPAAPVATLLAKPVYRSDCLSQSSGIGSVEVGIQRLILMALMDDFCRREVTAPSQGECVAFWETWQSAAERTSGKKLPVPAFDEAKIQAQLGETRTKLANKNAPWLERLQIEGRERSLVFALEHKSVAAHEAYNQLMPLRCQKALYEKYGGKVVGMQISIEPVGAYQKLIEEAEASGKLKFHDAALEQSFRKRMNEYASHREVPPEFVDFSLPTWLQVSLQRPATTDATPAAQPPATNGNTAAARSNDLDMLSRFVGTWKLSTTAKPAKWLPDGGTFTGQESTVWALKNRVILIRDMSQPDGKKGLWIVTYDPRQNAYPLWGFDSKGLMGAQWRLTWDKATSTASGIGTDMPANWTSGGKNHFPDADTNLVTAWIKDENGELLLDHEGKKARQPDEHEAAIVAAWKKHEPAADRPVELKVLDRMIGEWNLVHIQKPAAWTPDGGRTTSKIERQWILDGRFVMETAIISDGRENMSLFGFDPQNKVYRGWWFSSDGNRNTPTGSWDEQSQTMSFVTDLDDGIKIRSSGRFADPNQEVWEFKATDAVGKVYLDMEITATRQAAAGGNVPKANDQSQLQGTWGAIAFLQDGQRGDEPIAPEDAAIKYIFKGDQFTLLASGNAGETPKGTFKLGTSGKGKTIDLIFPPDSNGTKGQTMSGVYELDGDTLKVTYAPQGAIVFKRIKE